MSWPAELTCADLIVDPTLGLIQMGLDCPLPTDIDDCKQ